MKARTRISFSPATAIALVALFFALGGSAFAVGERMQAASANQKRCASGAVRGVAAVTGNPAAGIANIPTSFSGAGNLFARRFNCTGRGVQVRRNGLGVYEIRFPGIAAGSAIISSGAPQHGVEALPDGTFRVSLHSLGIRDNEDRAFTIVVV